jgi:WD40 repeat protein
MVTWSFPLTKSVSGNGELNCATKQCGARASFFEFSNMQQSLFSLWTGTSLKIIPSGRLIVAGFTDGTLRLFDLDGGPAATSSSSPQASAESEDELSFEATTAKNNALVCSKAHQRYGAVACQIHARGVHTSLLMHVDCSEDGLYCFGGVIRGSMELVAVDISNITNSSGKDLLDLIRVHRHSDAKLKGFGACTRLQGETQKYLLLTGKGIKNIHIWSFEPNNPTEQWQCLYDTQTNGNTISILHWRYDPNGLLQAMSKSDSQKLRVWDLSHEQHGGDSNHPLYHKQSTIHQLAKQNTPCSKERPKRPPYVDVASTESALGICGSFCFGGGYNQVSVVSLDVENVGSPYNHTEMALPGGGGSRRRQRGDLQSIVRVAGMTKDAGHVLLELSNVRIIIMCEAIDEMRHTDAM